MKIYKVTAVRTAEYYIAVKDNQVSLVIAENNLEDAFDLAQTRSITMREMDVFDKRLDGVDIYGLDFDELDEIREQMRGEK
jgi:hypothetical protein